MRKKIRFFVLKKSSIIVVVLFVVLLFGFAFFPSVFVSSPSRAIKVVIDAGHGGIDGGCEGNLEGSNERELNLKYAKCLKKEMEEYGFEVVMTRTTTDGLYSAFAPNKKKDDMKKRKEIIEKANPDLVISIHMNAFPQKTVRGAQVYYNSANEVSKALAYSIQENFKKDLPFAKSVASVGDYYILNCTNTPSVIVECGFLSNFEEESLLLSNEYCEKVCYSLLCGVIKYLN